MTKWNKAFWTDLAERVGSTALYGVIAMLTADASGVVSGDPRQWWAIVGLPAALSFLKGVLVNMGGEKPTASIVGVTSNQEV